MNFKEESTPGERAMIVIFLVAVLIVVHGFQIISPVQDQSICFGREFQVTVDVGEDKIEDFSIAFGHSVICSVPGELGVSGSYSCQAVPVDYGITEIMAQGMIGGTIIQSKISVEVVAVDENDSFDSSMCPIVRIE